MLAILDRQRGLTPALARQSPQVSGLLREEDTAVATTQALTNALLFTCHQFNVVRNMANLQMGLLADELLERYWYWRFDEFLYVLREGIAQSWGKTYDRLDPPTVHEWCKAYEELRNQQTTHETEQAADAFKKRELLPEKPALNSQAYFALRATLDRLSDQELVDGLAMYEARPDPTEADAFKIFVAQEAVNDRRAAHYLRQIGERFRAPERDGQALESAYRHYRANWITERLHDEATTSAALDDAISTD